MKAEVARVRESFSRSILNDVMGKFYEIFLVSHPDIKPMFVRTDLKTQKELLKHGIHLAIMYSDDNPVGVNGLSRIRDTHSKAKMNIPTHLYSYWKASFLKAIAQCDPQFTEQTRKDWDIVLQKAISHLTS